MYGQEDRLRTQVAVVGGTAAGVAAAIAAAREGAAVLLVDATYEGDVALGAGAAYRVYAPYV